MLPELKESNLLPGGSGVRTQTVDTNSNLLDDFRFVYTLRTIHVLNVPSPAATGSLEIAREIGDQTAAQLGLSQ